MLMFCVAEGKILLQAHTDVSGGSVVFEPAEPDSGLLWGEGCQCEGLSAVVEGSAGVQVEEE